MIGQKNLLKKLNSYTTSSLPHSILLLGEEGSEQEEVCDFICDKFEFIKTELTDVKAEILRQTIDDLLTTVNPTLCIIDFNVLMNANNSSIYFNSLLKLFEEPSVYTYIILKCSNVDLVPETIKTRSFILKCDTYSKQDLVELIHNKEQEEIDLVLNICHTPGQIELANHCDIKKLYDECVRLRDSLQFMLAYEVLDYSNKINFKDNYDKYDFNLFTKMLKYVIMNKYKLYKDVVEFEKYAGFMVQIGKMNGKQAYFDKFMLKLWEDAKDGN